MDRREFFRRSIKKATNSIVKEVDSRISKKASHWIRPPYAIAELDFLLACTRCGDCITACPPAIIFPLPARLGADVVNTPALDLVNKGCRLCSDWPCVQACTVAALKIPDHTENDDVVLPRLARARIDEMHCLPYSGPECGVCVDICPVNGAMSLVNEKPVIHAKICTGCGLCREHCVVDPKAILITSIYQQEPAE